MTEEVATEVAAPAAAAPAAPPPAAPPAEPVATDSAEQATSASAPQETETSTTEEQPEKRRSGSFERKLKRLYREIGEHKARADLLDRQNAELRQQSKPPADPTEPKLESFTDLEEYAKAKADHAVKKASQQAEQERQTKAQREFVENLTASWDDKVEKFVDENPDFESLVGELKPVNALTIAIMDEDNGPQVALHLAKNPKEAHALAAMPPLKQAKEVAKLAARLAAEPAKPKTPSKAPAPITPVGGKSGGANALPQDSDDINTWMQKERAREKALRSG